MVGTSSSSSIICRVSSRLASNPLYQNSLPDKQINTRGNGAYILSAMNFAGLRPRGFRLPFLSSLSLSPSRWSLAPCRPAVRFIVQSANHAHG